MRSFLAGAAPALAALALVASSSHACGDKFLVTGRGQSYYRMHLAARPAAILIYQSPGSAVQVAGEKSKMENSLRDAGHRVAVCGAALDCDLAVSVGGYDIVMADIADAPKVAEKLRSESSRTVVVPIGYKAPKSEVQKAKSDFGYVYESPSSPGKLLKVIDDVMSKQSRTASAATTN